MIAIGHLALETFYYVILSTSQKYAILKAHYIYIYIFIYYLTTAHYKMFLNI